MATRGPALNFDPHYVDILISAWRECNFLTMRIDDLLDRAAEHAERVFADWTIMGLAEQHAKRAALKSAVALLKSLKLVKQTTSRSGDSTITTVPVAALGYGVLSEEPAVGSIRVGLIGILVKSSPPLSQLLNALDGNGPLSRPAIHVLPGVTRRRTAFNRAVIEGLREVQARQITPSSPLQSSTAKQTATQLLKEVAAQATARHPASTISGFEKLLAMAADLGLLWRDVEPVNNAIAIETFGSATATQAGATIPNVPSWHDVEARFRDVLLRVYIQRVGSSGFATVEAVRGGVGRELRISAAVVDAFLRHTREAGDRGEWPYRLQFEPNDDLLYSTARRPLIWQETAFDFIEIHRPSTSVETASRSAIGMQSRFHSSS